VAHTIARAVRFSSYGGPGVLELVEVPIPVPGPGEVVVRVVAAGLNPVETSIREGRLQRDWPAEFPIGQGTDFAGLVVSVNVDVPGWSAGDAVMGHAVRRAQANFVVVPSTDIIAKPERLSWEVAGSLYTVAMNAWRAVQSANPQPGRTVLVHAAAGGVGGIAAQLAKLRGAVVIGTASPDSFDYLRGIGIRPVQHGDGLTERLAEIAPNGVDAELDRVGDDSLANVESTDETNTTVLARIARMIADRQLTVPIAAIYPFEQVRAAYRELEAGHAHGKIVLTMDAVAYPHQKVHGVDVRETEATRDRGDRAVATEVHEALPPVFGHPHHHPAPPAES